MALFMVSSEQNGIFPLTSMDSQIIHKDCGGNLQQDIGCYFRKNTVIPKSPKPLDALLLRDYCTDISQPWQMEGFLHSLLSISTLSLLCHVLFCFFPLFFLLDFLMLKELLLFQADVSLPVFRDGSQFLEHSSFFLVPVSIKGRKRGSRTKNIFLK